MMITAKATVRRKPKRVDPQDARCNVELSSHTLEATLFAQLWHPRLSDESDSVIKSRLSASARSALSLRSVRIRRRPSMYCTSMNRTVRACVPAAGSQNCPGMTVDSLEFSSHTHCALDNTHAAHQLDDEHVRLFPRSIITPKENTPGRPIAIYMTIHIRTISTPGTW